MYVTKRCIDVYIEPLTHIIDKSFKEGIFPSELKERGTHIYTYFLDNLYFYAILKV